MAPRVRAIRAALNGLDWTRDELDQNRDECLRELVRHVYDNVPYYRAAFDRAGLQPQQIQGLADIGRIPITTRADIQAAPGQFIASDARHTSLISHLSSGSRGMPVHTKRTLFEERILSGIRLRVLMRYGMRLTDKRASVSMEDAGDRPLASYIGFFGRTLIDAGMPPQDALRALCAARPDVIIAYPASLARLVEFITPEQRRRIQPRLITLGGEMVLTSFRRDIAECFQCPVRETYGATEANLIAWGCPVTGHLHIAEHSVIVEICKEDQPVAVGEAGEAIITVLHSRAMPFLRYRLNDLVTRGPAPCPCGHPAATLIAVRGRTNDWFKLPDGRLLHPFVVSDSVMDHIPGLRRLQITQTSERELTIAIVPGQVLSAASLAEAEGKIAASVGYCFQIKLKTVQGLDRGPNQKFNPFVPLRDWGGGQ